MVVDTLFRALAGGNENGPEDMGSLVRNADLIRQETGAAVIFVHHCGKDAVRGARGHSSLKAATDTEIEVTRNADGLAVARVTRQRDLEAGGTFAFRLASVDLGLNARGKPVTSCAIQSEAAPAAATTGQNNGTLTDNERIALRTLDQTMKADGILAAVGHDFTERKVARMTDWRAWFYRAGKPEAEPDARQRAFRRAVDRLMAVGRIAAQDDFVWPTGSGT